MTALQWVVVFSFAAGFFAFMRDYFGQMREGG
jgi:hypothetical protein